MRCGSLLIADSEDSRTEDLTIESLFPVGKFSPYVPSVTDSKKKIKTLVKIRERS